MLDRNTQFFYTRYTLNFSDGNSSWPHNTAVVAPAPLRSFRRPHARLHHMMRRVTRNFMHSVELDSHFNNLISKLINMLKSKNCVSVAKNFSTPGPARLQEFIQDASIYLHGA